MTVNQQWTIARTPPEGWPLDDDFAWTQAPIASPGTNQMLTRTIYLSLDPYQWGRRRSACPDGADIYFESVGGEVFEAVLPLLNRDSRITLCGMISQIGNTDGEDAYKRWRETGKPTFDKQATQVHGLAVRNFVADYQDRFLAEMADWINDSLVKYKEDLWMGLEAAPNAFRAMLQGGNFGKTLVAVGEDPTLNAVLEARRAGDNVFG